MSDVNLFGEPDSVPGPPAKKPWTSPSRLSMFLKCPRQYEYSVVKKFPTAPSPHFDLGTNVHAALRDWLRLPPAQRTWDAMLDAYRASWQKNRAAFATRSREDLREWGERGKAMLRRFADETPPDVEPVALEKNVRVDYGDVVVGGRVDRVDALPDGTLAVIDYKTGKTPSAKHEQRAREEDLAPPVYARGAADLFAGIPVSRVEYLYLDTMERRTIEVDPVWQAQRDATVVTAAHHVLDAERDGDFPAQPSKLCGWCDHRTRCLEGQAFLARGASA